MPRPGKGEKRKAFLDRCMADPEAGADFPDQASVSPAKPTGQLFEGRDGALRPVDAIEYGFEVDGPSSDAANGFEDRRIQARDGFSRCRGAPR